MEKQSIRSTSTTDLKISLDSLVRSGENNYWIMNGIYFGYPVCCIIDFCTRGYNKTPEQDKVHNNLGFVPCPKCSKKIVDGKETLRSLIKNRICPNTFPNH